VSISRNALSPSDRDFGDGLGMPRDQMTGAMSPSSVINSWKKRRDHSTGLPRRPSLTGDGDQMAAVGFESFDQPVDQRR